MKEKQNFTNYYQHSKSKFYMKSEFYPRMEVIMKSDWILKTDELPSAYEEVEIIMIDGNIPVSYTHLCRHKNYIFI